MTDDLFGHKSTEPRKKLSTDSARVLRDKARIARGVHPFGMKLRQPPGETCGTCRHLYARSYAGTYFKCRLRGASASRATDARKSWPACTSWAAKP